MSSRNGFLKVDVEATALACLASIEVSRQEDKQKQLDRIATRWFFPTKTPSKSELQEIDFSTSNLHYRQEFYAKNALFKSRCCAGNTIDLDKDEITAINDYWVRSA